MTAHLTESRALVTVVGAAKVRAAVTVGTSSSGRNGNWGGGLVEERGGGGRENKGRIGSCWGEGGNRGEGGIGGENGVWAKEKLGKRQRWEPQQEQVKTQNLQKGDI